MKKIVFTAMVLLSMLALLTGTVSAAPPAAGLITLVEVRNDTNGDVIFIFNVSGDFAKPKLNGTVEIQGQDANYGLHCSLVGADTIQCNTSKKAGGHNVVVYLAGFIFWTFVPEASGPAGSTKYCYGVYDYYFDQDTETAYWAQFDTHCQDVPANYADTLQNFYNPDYNGYYDYDFMPGSPNCYNPINGDAYYYPNCAS